MTRTNFPKNSALRPVGLWLAAGISATLIPTGVSEGSESTPSTCSADTLLIEVDQSIRLRVEPADSQPDTHTWLPDVGTVQREGKDWKWTLSGASPGIHSARYVPAHAAAAAALCQVEVIVTVPGIELRGGYTRQAARAVLVAGEPEPQGYGLYSYILILRPPDAANLERHLRLIEEYLRFPDVAQLELYVSRYRNIRREDARRELNATFVFLTDKVPEAIASRWDKQDFRPVAEWILKHYDYARAQAVASMVDRNIHNGPYIISMLNPLGTKQTSELLLQDQSAVPAQVVGFWVKEFLYQSAQEKYWEPRSARSLMLRVRTMVAVAAEAWIPTRSAMGEMIKWTKTASVL